MGCRYEDIKAEAKKPYLLGGEQEPKCTACKLDNNWVGFSRYESNGPICPWVRSQAFEALPCLTSGKGSLTLSLLLYIEFCGLDRVWKPDVQSYIVYQGSPDLRGSYMVSP